MRQCCLLHCSGMLSPRSGFGGRSGSDMYLGQQAASASLAPADMGRAFEAGAAAQQALGSCLGTARLTLQIHRAAAAAPAALRLHALHAYAARQQGDVQHSHGQLQLVNNVMEGWGHKVVVSTAQGGEWGPFGGGVLSTFQHSMLTHSCSQSMTAACAKMCKRQLRHQHSALACFIQALTRAGRASPVLHLSCLLLFTDGSVQDP